MIDIQQYLQPEGEQPLDKLVADAGLCGIFRTIGCVGDSLASGEFESMNEAGERGYHDYFEYSWGQFLARDAGCTVYNFSRGGMTASEYCNTFAAQNDFWNPALRCQAYILALGCNDLINARQPVGTVADIDLENWENNADTFAGHYAKIIQRYRALQPKARFFLMTMPRQPLEPEQEELKCQHQALLYELAKLFPFTYVLDFNRYAPVYDKEFEKSFFMGGHMNAAGYRLTARMVENYIDYIIRHNMEDFTQVGFIGKDFHNAFAKW